MRRRPHRARGRQTSGWQHHSRPASENHVQLEVNKLQSRILMTTENETFIALSVWPYDIARAPENRGTSCPSRRRPAGELEGYTGMQNSYHDNSLSDASESEASRVVLGPGRVTSFSLLVLRLVLPSR